MTDADEARKAPLLIALRSNVLLERLAHHVRGRATLAASQPFQLGQKSGIEQY